MNSPEFPHEPATGKPADGVERLLASFAPRPSRLDRDRLLFLAGQASIETAVPTRTPWYWPASTAMASLCAAVLAIVLLVQASSSRDTSSGRGPALAGQGAPAGMSRPNPARESVRPASPDVEQPSSTHGSAKNPSVEASPPNLLAALEVAPNSVLQLRAASFREGFDTSPLGRTGAGREEPPSTYLRAVRSALERPQALSLELRY